MYQQRFMCWSIRGTTCSTEAGTLFLPGKDRRILIIASDMCKNQAPTFVLMVHNHLIPNENSSWLGFYFWVLKVSGPWVGSIYSWLFILNFETFQSGIQAGSLFWSRKVFEELHSNLLQKSDFGHVRMNSFKHFFGPEKGPPRTRISL